MEKVIIKTDDPEYKEILNKQGAIIGFPDEEDEDKSYYVYFEDDCAWGVPEAYLESTGEFELESKIYDGTTIKIKVDMDAEGHLMEED